jgi:hypothetical protein
VFTPSLVGLEDNTTGWWSAFSEDQKIPSGSTVKFSFTNYNNGAANWDNFLVILRNAELAEYAVVRADNWGWGGTGYNSVSTGCTSGVNWATWLAAMNGGKVTVYATNYGDGKLDLNIWMVGTNGITYFQYYYGIDVDANDLQLAFTVEGGHLVSE